MNQIATRGAFSVAPMPEFAPSLEAAIMQRTVTVKDAHYVRPPDPSPALVEIARATMREIGTALHPCSPDHLKKWLSQIGIAIPMGGTQGDQDRMHNAMKALTTACGHMPAECFSQETLRQVIQQCRWFPSGAELFAILDPIHRRLKARGWALREIAEFKPGHDEWHGPKNQSEREQMAQNLASLAAEIASRVKHDDAEPPPIKPAHATKLQLAQWALARGETMETLRCDLRAALVESQAVQETEV